MYVGDGGVKYRKLGDTGLEVSEIGFGAWGIGGLSRGASSYGRTSDEESKLALRLAFESGITLFDTSDLYGYGHSEILIGETLKDVRQQTVIASKVGFLEHNGPQDFSPKHIRKSIEGSLHRLQTDYLDLYQLHSPPIDLMERDDSILHTLSSLQTEGKIRAFGISARSPDDGLIAIQRLGFKSVQVNFNMVDQRAVENGLFGLAEKENAGIIVRTPLCFGFLTGGYSADIKFNSRDHRSTWPAEQIERWASAHQQFSSVLMENETQTGAQVALRFCLSYSSVSAAIPGMLTREEVRENVMASHLGPFVEGEMLKINKVYQNSTFFLGKAPSKS